MAVEQHLQPTETRGIGPRRADPRTAALPGLEPVPFVEHADRGRHRVEQSPGSKECQALQRPDVAGAACTCRHCLEVMPQAIVSRLRGGQPKRPTRPTGLETPHDALTFPIPGTLRASPCPPLPLLPPRLAWSCQQKQFHTRGRQERRAGQKTVRALASSLVVHARARIALKLS